MHSWLTSLPYFGSVIIDWERNKVIKPKAKAAAVGLIFTSIGITITFAKIHYGLKFMLAIIAISVTTFILTRKSYAKNHFVDTNSCD